jgi:hypothetical protein
MKDFKFLDNLEPIENNYSLIRKNQSNFKIKYVINSHVDYMEEALAFMLPYAKAEIPKEDILVVLGGGNSNYSFIHDEVEFQVVDYNAWDFHSFIYIIENSHKFVKYEYIFYMHDTCCPYRGFYDATYNIKRGKNAYALSDAMSSNIGLYKLSYLMSHNIENFKKLKNVPGPVGTAYEDFLLKGEGKQNSYNKRKTIYEKGVGDKLFHLGNNRKSDPVSSFKPNIFKPWPADVGNDLPGFVGQYLTYKDVYHTGNYRRVIYWKSLNLAKFKSNYKLGGYGGR